MGYRCTFMDNQVNTVEDLNSISVNLHSTDNVAFSKEDIIGADDLNNISKNLITKGISHSIGSECSVSVNDETITVNSGTAFFGNGMCIIIDEYGISTTKNDIKIGYIYLYYDYNLNEIRLEHSSSLPDDEAYYVALYKLSNNELTDIRQYASMKNPSVLPNKYDTIELDIEIPQFRDYGVKIMDSFSLDFPLGGAYKKMFLYTSVDGSSERAIGWFDFENEKVYTAYSNYGEDNPLWSLDFDCIIKLTSGYSDNIHIESLTYNSETQTVTFVLVSTGDYAESIHKLSLRAEVM